MNDDISHMGVAELRALMDSGNLTAESIVQVFLDQIEAVDRTGPTIRSIIETNPDALEIARSLDAERRAGKSRGPLHGIPILLKDNIDTADAMLTTAGSLALVDSRPSTDAFVAGRLRAAGAILLGKANMSEWANFRSSHSSSGWSARGGQALNPHVLDRSPCGSSSGSASAVAAQLAPIALGTETDGSILCPAAMCGVVGIKPTVGLTSRSGVIPISHTQDTVGPFARSVADAALALNAIAAVDPDDPATSVSAQRSEGDLTRFLEGGGLRGARIGVARAGYFGYSPGADAAVEDAMAAMRDAGAVMIDPADIPSVKGQDEDGEPTVMLYEFKAGINRYLKTRKGDGPKTLADLIEFNEANSRIELAYFGQEMFLKAQEKGGLTEPAYLKALADGVRRSREEGIDAVMDKNNLDAVVMPTTGPAFTIDLINGDHFLGASSSAAARAGYPAISVPAGNVHDLPVGITFMGRAFSELTLIRLAHAFEELTKAWRPAGFLPKLHLPGLG